MKLRTKISLITASVILATVAAISAVLWKQNRDLIIRNAEAAAMTESTALRNEFEEFLIVGGENMPDEAARYFFKSRREDLIICLKNGRELFNNTTTEAEAIINGYKTGRYPFVLESGERGSLVAMTIEGHNVRVYSVSVGEYDLYRICDIDYADESVGRMTAIIAAVAASASVIAVVLSSFLIGRSLSPLGRLSKSARAIASGDYGERLDAARDDEIGEISRDFNEMASAVERREASLVEAERRTAAFASALTHELKTPLTSISGYAETMRRAALTSEERGAAEEYIVKESARLDALSKKLMRLFEIENSEDEEISVISVADAVKAAVDAVLPASGVRGVRVTCGDLYGMVAADFDLFCDAVFNLLENAVKASGDGDEVEIFTEDNALIVQDRGVGISEDDLSRITEPFYMADKSRSRKNGGAGLGLSLVDAVCRRYGMTLSFESRVGVGTEAKITF